jgi:hypothetical protein
MSFTVAFNNQESGNLFLSITTYHDSISTTRDKSWIVFYCFNLAQIRTNLREWLICMMLTINGNESFHWMEDPN